MEINKNRITFMGCPIDSITMNQTVQMIDNAIQSKKQIHHVVVNAAKLVHLQNDDELKQSVISSDIINADGQSVVWGAKFLGQYLPERVAGIDLMDKVVKLANQKKYKIFLFGAKEEVVLKIIEKYSTEYSSGLIVGYRNGYYNSDEENFIAETIAKSGADILFVAMTSPKKEIFLNKYKHIITTSFIMGVGGSFDVVSGFTKRAPLWMQEAGLEWSYRIYQEPGRMWKRYLITNTLFIYHILKTKIFGQISL